MQYEKSKPPKGKLGSPVSNEKSKLPAKNHHFQCLCKEYESESRKYEQNKNGHILPTGEWYAPSAVINDALIMHE